KLTNSHASRAYFDTGCKLMCLMKAGMKHSLCLISIVSKAQPSESMPMRKSYFLPKRSSGVSDIAVVSGVGVRGDSRALLGWLQPPRAQAPLGHARREAPLRVRAPPARAVGAGAAKRGFAPSGAQAPLGHQETRR